MAPGEIEFRTHSSIRDIPREQWNGLLGPEPPPHLRWEFLEAFESTGCLGEAAGWLPCPISLLQGGEFVGAAPAYLKGNSEGEFVFDHSWARFSHERLRVSYYPKLIVAVPFTPATGPRLLVKDPEQKSLASRAFVQGLKALVDHAEWSSAHVLLPEPGEALALRDAGLSQRYGLQYHWQNADYGCFDDFLGRFNSKRRHQIRAERQAIEEQGLELEIVTGSDWSPVWVDHAYEFYRRTVDKYFWGRRYLNRHFFEQISQTMPDNLLMVVARDKSSKACLAGAFNLVGAGAMYGRYWGAVEERPFLHFNVCYYRGIEECIRRRLATFEPGAGGEHKLARGFEPTVTHSLHYIRHPAFRPVIDDFLQRERSRVEEYLSQEKPVLKAQLKAKG